VAGGWCCFVLREEYWWLVTGGWFVLREKYCWLVADKPNEQAENDFHCPYSLEPAWTQGTNSSLTYFSLLEGLKFQAPLTKHKLKLVLRLKFFSQENPY
jgi:hypothetical protein